MDNYIDDDLEKIESDGSDSGFNHDDDKSNE